MMRNKRASWDMMSFIWGTLFTLIQIGLFFLIINLFATYTIGTNASQVFASMDFYRESLHQQAGSISGILVFITEKAFVQFMIFIALLGLWFTNINWIDKKRSNHEN